MDFEQVVFARRSVRAYTGEPVSDGEIEALLSYGHAAPSGGNACGWAFIVIRSAEAKRKVAQATYCGACEANPPQSWLETAPVLIAVVADQSAYMRKYGRHALDNLLYLDASACVENMLLGAVHLNLASCYISGFRMLDMAKALNLPGHMEPVAILPVGHPAEVGAARPRKPLAEIVHFEKFPD
ncbi:MAG: hypothetical protein GX592_15205 [Clostridiales bacterium]|nr:hypothetical protein [Clostridiales bacterium]